MMEINKTGPVGGPSPLDKSNKIRKTQENGRVSKAQPQDKVELSRKAYLLERLSQLPDVRIEKINEIRELIESGKYETDEKWDVAIERILRDITS